MGHFSVSGVVVADFAGTKCSGERFLGAPPYLRDLVNGLGLSRNVRLSFRVILGLSNLAQGCLYITALVDSARQYTFV